MPPARFRHTVVGGRLVLIDPGAETEISQLEAGWIQEEAQRLPEASFRWGLDRLGPPRPPVGEVQVPDLPFGVRLRDRPASVAALAPITFVRIPRPVTREPMPEGPVGIPQVARQEQLLRIQEARQLYEERPGRYLGAIGTVWVVDGQRIFVSERDPEVLGAIQARLAEGETSGRPAPAPAVEAPGPVTIFRVLPVGDTR